MPRKKTTSEYPWDLEPQDQKDVGEAIFYAIKLLEQLEQPSKNQKRLLYRLRLILNHVLYGEEID